MKRLIKKSEDEKIIQLKEQISEILTKKNLTIPSVLKINFSKDNSLMFGVRPDGTLDINQSNLNDWANIMHEIGHVFDIQGGKFGKYSLTPEWQDIILNERPDYFNFSKFYGDLEYEGEIDPVVLESILTEAWAEAFEGYTYGTENVSQKQLEYMQKVLK